MVRPEFSHGIHIHAEKLAGLRVLAPLLPLHKQKKILHGQSGGHISRLRGRGIDFSEVREYQAGDDIRSMDWRVTARTGEAHIKVFREERERPVLVACDLRAAMNFGTRRTLKKVLAADIAALLAWSANGHGDRVGGLIFNDEQEFDLRPNSGRKTLMAFLHQLSAMPLSKHQPAHVRMLQMCRHIARIARPGTAIYIVSDWHGFDAECERALFATSRHCDIVAIHVSDPFERNLAAGQLTLSDGIGQQILQGNRETVQKHQAQWDARLNALNEHLLPLRSSLTTVTTQQDPLEVLRLGLGVMSQGVRGRLL
ncbi:MAG: DUF58 domain-containing protein [Oleibacter sp.]|nr:DUF58 domain-containing protein [Thalassolituus sp.]